MKITITETNDKRYFMIQGVKDMPAIFSQRKAKATPNDHPLKPEEKVIISLCEMFLEGKCQE